MISFWFLHDYRRQQNASFQYDAISGRNLDCKIKGDQVQSRQCFMFRDAQDHHQRGLLRCNVENFLSDLQHLCYKSRSSCKFSKAVCICQSFLILIIVIGHLKMCENHFGETLVGQKVGKVGHIGNRIRHKCYVTPLDDVCYQF